MARAYRILLPAIFSILSHQLFAARYWVATTASNWNNTANWATTSGGRGGASVPGAADPVNFDFNGRGSCSIDVPVNIQKLTVSFGYTGTIFQGAHPIDVATNSTFSSGTFSGGTADITFAANFTLSGGTFTATSGTLEFDGNTSFLAGTFNHNNGTVLYVATGGTTTISGNSPTFYGLEFAGEGFDYDITSNGHVKVLNSLNLSGTQAYNLNTGTIDVTGNIDVTNVAPGCSGSALVNINGTGAQLIKGSTVAGAGALPQVTINKTSGTLSLSNYPASSNTFTYTAGTVNPGTSTWCFIDGTNNTYTIRGSLTLNNITFLAIANQTFTIPAATILTTTGDLTIAGTNKVTINTGNINVKGNLYLANTATNGGGTALITVNGTGSQAIDGTAIAINQDLLPFLTINKTAGTLTLKGNISAGEDWKYTAGTVDASTFSSTVAFGGNNLNITSAGMSFYNVTVTGNTISLSNSLTAKGNLAISAGKIVPGANTINLAGSWSDYGTAGFTEGTGTVNLNGSNLQTISTPGGETFANLIINNTGPGIRLVSSTTAGASLTMTAGNIDLNGNTLTTGLSVANNGVLNYTGGTIINTGSVTRWFKAAAITGMTGLFPVGTTANYRPVIVTTSTSPAVGGTISVFYSDAPTNSAVSFADGASTVLLRKDLNWTMTEANGLTGGTYNLQIQGTGFGQIGSLSDLRLTLANSVIGTTAANGGSLLDPQVNRTGLTARNLNNSFYIASINPMFTSLPLDLLYFNGNMQDGQVTLDWATPADNDAVWFIIQRSADGSSWQDFQKLAAHDTAAGTVNDYTSVDPAPYPGISFYRLHQLDVNGNSMYSAILSFGRATPSGNIIISPVPATDHLTITFPGPGKYSLMLLNAIGQLVRDPLYSTGNSLTWQVGGLPAGVYFVRIAHNGVTETRTVLIK